MAQTISLHGGPWHGRHIAIPEDWDNFIVTTYRDPIVELSPEDKTPEVRLRKGTYSAVRYQSGDFEWDGWRD